MVSLQDTTNDLTNLHCHSLINPFHPSESKNSTRHSKSVENWILPKQHHPNSRTANEPHLSQTFSRNHDNTIPSGQVRFYSWTNVYRQQGQLYAKNWSKPSRTTYWPRPYLQNSNLTFSPRYGPPDFPKRVALWFSNRAESDEKKKLPKIA